MKNILIKSLLALAAVGAATGCIEETFPQGGSQTQAQVSKNEAALQGMLNSIPSSMVTSGVMGYATNYGDHTDFGLGGIFLRTEFMLEDLATMGENPFYNRFYSYCLCENMGSKYIAPSYFWDAYYTWIKTANDVISLIEPDTEDPNKQRILGQAYAFRAYCYLDLARLYEPKENKYLPVSSILELTVPKITQDTKEADANYNPRMPRKDMYDFILEDLTQAGKLLAGKQIDYKMPGESAVNVMFARAYLEKGAAGDEGAYEKAIEYAEKVLTGSGKTPLTQDEWENPTTGFNKGDANNSWIWGIPTNSELQSNIITFISHISGEAQWGYCQLSHIGISKALYERISDSDFRKHSWLDPKRFEYYDYKFAGSDADKAALLNGIPGQLDPIMDYQSLKFRPANGNCTDYTVGNAADLCVMRVEEVYFIKAEALAQLGRLNEAATVLNSLIKTRNPEYDASKFTTEKDAFLDEMLLQKRIEFWGEGILFYDYKRLDHGITRSYDGSNHAQVFALNCEGRSPQWNIVITVAEYQGNTAITEQTNNPDPSQFVQPTPID